MKSIYRLLLVILFSLTGLVAEERIYFDIKTDIKDKIKLLPIELGTIFMFSQSDWGGVLEIGEDYGLYLRNYQRKKTSSAIYLKMVVELRSPGGWKAGKVLRSQELHLKIKRENTNSSLTDFYNFIKSGFSLSDDTLHYETLIVAKVIEDTAYKLYKSHKENKSTVSRIPYVHI